MFTDEVVALAVDLVVDVGVAPELLEPLRRLAFRRKEFAQAAVVVSGELSARVVFATWAPTGNPTTLESDY